MAMHKYCKWNINRKMLPMKLHYLFYSTAIGSPLLYFPLLARNIGISATGLGVIFTIVPFVTILVNPIFGCITDKLKKIKFIIIFLTILHTPIYFSVNYIPEITKDRQVLSNIKLNCNNDTSVFIESSKFLKINPNNKSFECQVECSTCQKRELVNDTVCQYTFKLISEPFLNKTESIRLENITFDDHLTFSICSQELKNNCNTKCFLDEDEETNSFFHYQFWLFVILATTANIISDVILSLSDAACLECLEGKINQFGKQRVWDSIGWGVTSMISGYIIQLANANNKGKTDFSVCFYIMLPLMLLDIIAQGFTDMRKEKSSSNILNDIRKIFTKPHPFFVVIATFLNGAFLSLQWSYALWYLEELGASKILMGLSNAVVCIFGEVPFMFISGWIIKRIGRDNCIFMAIIAHSIWFLCTSFLKNPWWIILINLIQGPCYGLYFVVMSSYGKIVAPDGTEATMQTILGATLEGLGININFIFLTLFYILIKSAGAGSLVGGIGFDKFGGRLTYRFAGYITICTAVLYKCVTIFIADENSVIKENEGNKKKIEDTFMTIDI